MLRAGLMILPQRSSSARLSEGTRHMERNGSGCASRTLVVLDCASLCRFGGRETYPSALILPERGDPPTPHQAPENSALYTDFTRISRR
jgi:hypothetical protein